MKVLIGNRELIYKVMAACFATVGVKPRVAEVGVLKGGNAQVMDTLLQPATLHLIDAWSKEPLQEYVKNNAHRAWTENISAFADYFGGPLDEQATFDSLYHEVVQKFADKPYVEIVRASSLDAAKILRERPQPPRFDLLYLDASHQYETVLDDLLLYHEFVSEDGVIQMNDCCHSKDGIKQNLGVLEATVKFMKMSDFVSVLTTNTDYTDVLLVRRGSKMLGVIDNVVNANDITYVEVPPQLLGALTIRSGKRVNPSFC
jgi:hypothetical protein